MNSLERADETKCVLETLFNWIASTARNIYAARGEKEKALAELQAAFEKGYRDFTAIDASPYFASLRSDPRFQQLVRRYRQ